MAVASQQRTIVAVGHRGAKKFAPENTLSSFLKAAELGAEVVEMDVRQTLDGEFIIMHDATLSRTTNGSGKVDSVPLSYIRTLDAGSWFGPEFKGEPVPTLREVLRGIRGKVRPDIDFKAGDPKALVEILEAEGYLDGQTTIYTGSGEKLKEIRTLTDQLRIRPPCPRRKRGLDKFHAALSPEIININWWEFRRSYIRRIHEKGSLAWVNTLFAWFDNRRNMKKAIRGGADFIQTDRLDLLVPLIRSYEKGDWK